MLKTMKILLQRHNKKQNHILNVPIFTFKMSEYIRLKFFHKNTLCILQSVLLLVFIYMHSCERKKSLLLTVGYAKCIKKSMKNDSKGRARTKTKQRATKIKSKGAFK